MAGIRGANRCLGAAERIEEMVVVNMFEVEEAKEEESKFPIRQHRGKDHTWAVGWVMSTIEACAVSRQCTYMGESLPRSFCSLVKPGKVVAL